MGNTLNICVGHKPFPKLARHYIDITIAPNLVASDRTCIILPDESLGNLGGALSEYCQLLWLWKNLDSLAPDAEFIRVFHYRRFCAASPMVMLGTPAAQPWSYVVTEAMLQEYAHDFYRSTDRELYNAAINLKTGMLSQYAQAHVLEDMLGFASFLIDANVMDAGVVADFLRGEIVIPACNIGVFRRDNFDWTYSILSRAAGYLKQASFVRRTGYQRRNMGFLLERLHSYLLLHLIRSGRFHGRGGVNIVISENLEIVNTM